MRRYYIVGSSETIDENGRLDGAGGDGHGARSSQVVPARVREMNLRALLLTLGLPAASATLHKWEGVVSAAMLAVSCAEGYA